LNNVEFILDSIIYFCEFKNVRLFLGNLNAGKNLDPSILFSFRSVKIFSESKYIQSTFSNLFCVKSKKEGIFIFE